MEGKHNTVTVIESVVIVPVEWNDTGTPLIFGLACANELDYLLASRQRQYDFKRLCGEHVEIAGTVGYSPRDKTPTITIHSLRLVEPTDAVEQWYEYQDRCVAKYNKDKCFRRRRAARKTTRELDAG